MNYVQIYQGERVTHRTAYLLLPLLLRQTSIRNLLR